MHGSSSGFGYPWDQGFLLVSHQNSPYNNIDANSYPLLLNLNVLTASFDKVKQRCFTSKEKFSKRENKHCDEVNKMLDEIVETASRIYNSSVPDSDLLASIHSAILDLTDVRKNEKTILRMSPIEFFTYYIEQKRIDNHTGRYIGERTKIHQRTVIKRLSNFIKDKRLPDTFATFTSKNFDQQFTDWCYCNKKVTHYHLQKVS
jgi:hypothetical protein